MDLFNYKRRLSTQVIIGDTPLGGDNPVRIQSMTTTATCDIEKSALQAEHIADAGGEYVRLTTQGVREALALKDIKARMRADGYTIPLVADVHFNPHVADVAALYADKVRINPGNYVDPARTFRHLEYTDEEYSEELRRIEERFAPFLKLCRENGTAVRIGVNHGSLSDRIMSRYGDTPEGIVESCMEFLRVCRREHFDNVVVSIKASNTVVMVRSVRLLVAAMEHEDMSYPLHLGVTEAGEGEDGRIKSAVGIGALLADGIGDTIRVSLSEEPEAEIPVARKLVDFIASRASAERVEGTVASSFDYLHPERRATKAVGNIGGENVPIVIVSQDGSDCTFSKQQIPDYIYCAGSLPSRRSEGCRYIVDFKAYNGEASTYPLFTAQTIEEAARSDAAIKFVEIASSFDLADFIDVFSHNDNIVAVCRSSSTNRLGCLRSMIHSMTEARLTTPVVVMQTYEHPQQEKEDLQIEAAVDMGALLIDGLVDGLWIECGGGMSLSDVSSTAFGILQAARVRTTKTEYISCPGCGRTLYDLRSTIARIKEATSGMVGLKIGIMGCIVNGPGEMADADYGYVGAGRGKISLYRRKQCVEKNIPEGEAVERLLALINNDEANRR